MKKKIYLLSFISALTILLSGVVFASVPPTNNAGKISDLKQKITDVKQQSAEEKARIKENIASTTANIKNVRQELKNAIEIKIGKKLDEKKIKIADGFEKVIQNLKDLIARIESRISKMELSGTNVSSSKTLLATAKTKIILAETELTNLENFLAEDIPPVSTSTNKNTQRKTVLQQIKTQSEKTKSAIKVAQKSIIDVIVSLKPGLMKKNNSTSTSEIN